MPKVHFIPLKQMVDELRALVARHATGTIFIGTKKQQWAQLALDRGHICFVLFGGKRGEAALAQLRKEQEVCYNFKAGVVTELRDALGATERILTTLAANQTNGQGRQRVHAQDTVPSVRLALEELLTSSIGPVAQFSCEDVFTQCPDLAVAVGLLADEIPSSEEADEFLQKARQLL